MNTIGTDVDELRAMLDVLPDYIRQAHQAVRDIRQAIRDGQEEARRLIETDVSKTVEQVVETHITALTRAAEQAMQVHTQQIAAMFERLTRQLRATEQRMEPYQELPSGLESVGIVRRNPGTQRKGRNR